MGHETKAQLKDYVEVKIMKIKTTVAALSVLSVLSFGAFAADSIDAAQAQNREAIGDRIRKWCGVFANGYA
ncbi:protein YcfR [Escherichia coli]|nr:protein YcfR [Escherichia coli]